MKFKFEKLKEIAIRKKKDADFTDESLSQMDQEGNNTDYEL